ncbi:hypothetical protein ACTFIR_002940 [Dictyostelium discoideum]
MSLVEKKTTLLITAMEPGTILWNLQIISISSTPTAENMTTNITNVQTTQTNDNINNTTIIITTTTTKYLYYQDTQQQQQKTVLIAKIWILNQYYSIASLACYGGPSVNNKITSTSSISNSATRLLLQTSSDQFGEYEPNICINEYAARHPLVDIFDNSSENSEFEARQERDKGAGYGRIATTTTNTSTTSTTNTTINNTSTTTTTSTTNPILNSVDGNSIDSIGSSSSSSSSSSISSSSSSSISCSSGSTNLNKKLPTTTTTTESNRAKKPILPLSCKTLATLFISF